MKDYQIEFSDLAEGESGVEPAVPADRDVRSLAIVINGRRYVSTLFATDVGLRMRFRSDKQKIHTVDWTRSTESCTCEDYEYRDRSGTGTRCKHVAALAKLGVVPRSPEYLKPLRPRLRDLGEPDAACLMAPKRETVDA